MRVWMVEEEKKRDTHTRMLGSKVTVWVSAHPYPQHLTECLVPSREELVSWPEKRGRDR